MRGVTVRRFANAETRDIEAFNRYSDWIFHHPHTREDEMEWLRRQGPWCPALLEYLERHAASYDILIFFTYLYAPTVLGLAVAPSRSILVPTAHDEPAIHLDLYQDVFRLPAGLAYNTDAERAFLTSTFGIRAVTEETVGCGVDLSPQAEEERPRRQADRGAADPSARATLADASRLTTGGIAKFSERAARSFAGATVSTAPSRSMAAASILGRAVRNSSSTSAPMPVQAARPRWRSWVSS